MKQRVVLMVIVTAIVIIAVFTRKTQVPFSHITGQTMGKIAYNVKFIGEGENVKGQVDVLLADLNQSLSTYIPDSEISELNRTGAFDYKSKLFFPVLEKSKEVFDATDGAFDPSIGALVRAWGFEPDGQLPEIDSAVVDSLRSLAGFDHVVFDQDGVELPANFQLDFSAIAKGYAVDLVGVFLEEQGIENYLVEIGGEVRCRGMNEKGEVWSLGIEDPVVSRHEQKILAVVSVKDRSLATSGNYRNYYEKDGQLYAHIIDPRTGYTALHNLLSASVFAPDCMTADAYATACMVLGLEGSKKVIEQNEGLEAVFIYRDVDGTIQTDVSEGMESFITLGIEQK